LYVASAYFYSPFHWIFVLWKIHIFRVPQRIVIPLTSVVITLFVLCAHVWKRKKTLYVICIASLVWTWSVGWFTFSYTFVVPKKSDREFAKLVAKIDSSHSPVINIGTIPNFYLTQENIPILNYYYAWVPKNTPTFTYEDGKIHKEVVAKVRPLYVLVPLSTSLEDIEYSLSFHNNKYALWKSNK
ncbi:MAG TPA: hypothetical protein VEW42_04580, partial [Candidatus Eisenbacteria bacterium]|nr:hypothetical protein [Candidatus Eisenbacteria bacterium]